MLERQNPFEVEKKLLNITDGLGLPMDEGMLKPCVILNSLGFKTRQSCTGHKERYNTYPWIDLIWNKEKSIEYKNSSLIEFYQTIFQDLEEYYNITKPKHDNVLSFWVFNNEEILIVRICQVTDIKIFGNKRSQKMGEYFKEIQNFCEYLNNKYQLNY